MILFLLQFPHFSEQEPVLLVWNWPHMFSPLIYSAAGQVEPSGKKESPLVLADADAAAAAAKKKKIPRPPLERCKRQNKAFPRSVRQAAETPARSLSPRASIIGSASLALDFNEPIVASSLVHFIVGP